MKRKLSHPSQSTVSGLIGLSAFIFGAMGALELVLSGRLHPINLALFAVASIALIIAVAIRVSEEVYSWFITILYGAINRISDCRDSEIERVHDFATDFFGEDVTGVEKIRSICKKYRNGLKVGYSVNDRDIVGYIFYFPLNKTAVTKIKEFTFSAKDLTDTDVAKHAKYGHAMYIGAIAAKGFMAKAQMMGALKMAEQEAIKTRSKTVYARAATQPGLRILLKHKFEPVHPNAVGVGNFYFKSLQ